MKKKIIYGLLFAVAMVTASSSFVSCKDYEGDNYAELKNKNASLEEVLKQQKTALENCSTNCANQHALLWAEFLKYQPKGEYALKTDLDNYVSKAKFTTDSTNLANAIKTNATAISNLEKALNNYVTLDKFKTDSTEFMRLIKENQVAAAAAKALAEQANTLAKTDSVRIDGLTQNYNTLNDNFNTFINAWGKDLTSAIAEVARVRAIAEAVANDSAKWNLAAVNAQAALDTLKKYQDAWNLAAINAQETKDSLNKYQAAWNNAVVLAEKANDFIGDTKYNTLQELIDAYELADSQMADDIAALKDEVNKIKNTLAKQITGVIIQGTYSPVLGNGSLPLGIQTNLLAAYAGKATKDVEYFPSIYDEDYADGSSVFFADDQTYLQGLGFWPAGFDGLTKGDYILSDREDNAGKLYLTVNPTNVNFEGTTFDIVNSAGKVSKMQLSDLKPCKDVLNFGWTRGGATASVNGFYEANAQVTKENISALSANIDTKRFEQAFKEQLNSKGTGLVSYVAAMDLARAVYSSLEPLQRNGIRAQWQDEAAGLTRSYTSAYDIAATVIAPLGFGFTIPDSKYTRLPVFDTNYLKNKFHIKGDFSIQVIKDKKTEEKHIVLEVEEGLLEGDIIYQYDSSYYILGNESYLILASNAGYIQLDVTSMYQDVYGDIETALTPYESVVSQANKRIDYMVSYIDRYNRYATKINKFIRNANNLLQPVLLWCDGQNVGQLGGMISGNYAVGTIVPAGGAVALVPTSYTLELLAPAYKKSVVCTNVYKDGWSAQGAGDRLGMESALIAVNKALKAGGFDLYEGQSLKNAFIFDAKSEYEGMTFEFAYTALDYAGKIAGRKFYLTVGAAK